MAFSRVAVPGLIMLSTLGVLPACAADGGDPFKTLAQVMGGVDAGAGGGQDANTIGTGSDSGGGVDGAAGMDAGGGGGGLDTGSPDSTATSGNDAGGGGGGGLDTGPPDSTATSGNDAGGGGGGTADATEAPDTSTTIPVEASVVDTGPPPPDDAGPDCLKNIPASCPNCVTMNASDMPACEKYITCYLTNSCNPADSCGTDNDGVCGVNKIGGGSAPQAAAMTTYMCACP